MLPVHRNLSLEEQVINHIKVDNYAAALEIMVLIPEGIIAFRKMVRRLVWEEVQRLDAMINAESGWVYDDDLNGWLFLEERVSRYMPTLHAALLTATTDSSYTRCPEMLQPVLGHLMFEMLVSRELPPKFRKHQKHEITIKETAVDETGRKEDGHVKHEQESLVSSDTVTLEPSEKKAPGDAVRKSGRKRRNNITLRDYEHLPKRSKNEESGIVIEQRTTTIVPMETPGSLCDVVELCEDKLESVMKPQNSINSLLITSDTTSDVCVNVNEVSTETQVIPNIQALIVDKQIINAATDSGYIHDGGEGKEYNSESLILKQSDSKQNKAECLLCDLQLVGTTKLKLHVNKHHRLKWKPYCTIANDLSKSSLQKMSELQEMVERGNENNEQVKKNLNNCCFCMKSYTSESRLKSHMTAKHKDKPTFLTAINASTEKADDKNAENSLLNIECPYCKCVKRMKTIVTHMKAVHHEEPQFESTMTDVLKQVNFMRANYGKLYRMQPRKTKEDILYKCKFCGIEYKSSGARSVHQRFRCSSNPQRVDQYRCSVCAFTETDHDLFTEHMAEHTGRVSYLCDSCGKAFKSDGSLRSHVRVVHSQHPACQYNCELCGRTFSYKRTYQEHLLYHKGKREHPCLQCDKMFITKSDVQQHVRHVHLKPGRHRPRGTRSKLILSANSTQHQTSSTRIASHLHSPATVAQSTASDQNIYEIDAQLIDSDLVESSLQTVGSTGDLAEQDVLVIQSSDSLHLSGSAVMVHDRTLEVSGADVAVEDLHCQTVCVDQIDAESVHNLQILQQPVAFSGDQIVVLQELEESVSGPSDVQQYYIINPEGGACD